MACFFLQKKIFSCLSELEGFNILKLVDQVKVEDYFSKNQNIKLTTSTDNKNR
jgi:hypothetical protein